MRRFLPLLALLLVTACGQPARDSSSPQMRDSSSPQMSSSEPRTSYESGQAAAPAARMVTDGSRAASGPNIGPTAAPGVAFNYRYAFRLAAPRIAEVQEQHAQLCERLTVARCRITGMLYRVVNDRDIEAMLELKLDPRIARHFGRSGVEAVVRAEGMLIESEISGVDAASGIQAAGRTIAELTADLERIEARLRQRNLARDERERLDYQTQQLRQQIRALRENREAQQESLATTPMVFRYGSGDLVPGFGARPSFARALEQAVNNFVDGVYVLFIILISLLPWIILGLVGWWIVALLRRRYRARRPPIAPVEPVSSGPARRKSAPAP